MIKIGRKYKKWTVLRESEKLAKNGTKLFECLCICGKIQLLSKWHLLEKDRSFACMNCSQRNKKMSEDSYKELINTKCGKWLVLKQIDPIKKQNNKFEKYFECKCECGLIVNVRAAEIKSKRSLSCRSCANKCLECNCFGHQLNLEANECELLGFCNRCDKFCCFECNIDSDYSECNKTNKLDISYSPA